NGKEKIEIILNELKLKAPTFAHNIGISYQRIFDIQKGKTKNISGEIAVAISDFYPQYGINWLLGREGNNKQTSSSEKNNVRNKNKGDVFVGGNKIVNENKDEVTSQCVELLLRENKSFRDEVNKFHEVLLTKNKYIKEKDDYIKDIVHSSFERNESNLQRIDILMNELIETRKQNAELVNKLMVLIPNQDK
ncbi:MAG: hypothetical protein LBR34_10120, partial [Prevotella sp.]|nr:hypothetical protein [Prevotella sp.]